MATTKRQMFAENNAPREYGPQPKSLTKSELTEKIHTISDQQKELETALPPLWEVKEMDFVDPNHGGEIPIRVRIEHKDADVQIRVDPFDPWYKQGKKVLRSHEVKKRLPNKRYEPVECIYTRDTYSVSTREALDAVVVAAREFSERYDLFH